MFSKLSLYKLHHKAVASSAKLAEYLERAAFIPTTPNQSKAVGFVPPRAENGAFVESVAGQWIARFVVETRKVPADVLQRRVDEIVADIERLTGRKPGRKELREIKEQAAAGLLPQAFPKRVAVPVWVQVSPIEGVPALLAIGSTSAAMCDDVAIALARNVPDVMVEHIRTEVAPAAAMMNWLIPGNENLPGGENFEAGSSCELRANDETRASVRYKNQPMLIHGDARTHLAQGKVPVSLALTWCDRVAFTLTDDLQFKNIELLDVHADGEQADAFDANVALFTGEFSAMLGDLFGALGGMALAVQPPELPPVVFTQEGS